MAVVKLIPTQFVVQLDAVRLKVNTAPVGHSIDSELEPVQEQEQEQEPVQELELDPHNNTQELDLHHLQFHMVRTAPIVATPIVLGVPTQHILIIRMVIGVHTEHMELVMALVHGKITLIS
jgi:hypothetical protein